MEIHHNVLCHGMSATNVAHYNCVCQQRKGKL